MFSGSKCSWLMLLWTYKKEKIILSWRLSLIVLLETTPVLMNSNKQTYQIISKMLTHIKKDQMKTLLKKMMIRKLRNICLNPSCSWKHCLRCSINLRGQFKAAEEFRFHNLESQQPTHHIKQIMNVEKNISFEVITIKLLHKMTDWLVNWTKKRMIFKRKCESKITIF